LPWAGFMLSLLPQFWFTYITPSLAGRLATMSLFYAPGTAYGAYLCWRQALQEPTRSLRLIQLVSTALLGAGAVIFVVRLGLALSLSAGPVTAERRFMILVLPNFWGVLFNIWLPLALSLFLSARLRVFAQRSREQAEAASAARTRFLATMSHEIRTPLNGILGMAQLLLRHHLTREERDQSVEAIVRSGRKLLGVLDGVIDLARTDAGRLSLEKRSFHPSALVAEVHARFAPEAQAKGLRLESAWEGDHLRRGSSATSIFIYPPYHFKVVDQLFTNFHTPESTLLMLVSAFAGRELILETYAEAVRERYRFFSYGDAMYIR